MGAYIAGYLHNLVKPGAKPVYILMNKRNSKRLVSSDHCNKVDYEVFCDVDGEKVTFFSGQQESGYMLSK